MMNRRVIDIAILTLLLGGWILPSIVPPYGVVFGSTGLLDLYDYWNYLWLGEAGFFSGGVILEDTLEQGAHGHTFTIGPFIPSYILSILVPVSAILIMYLAISRRVVRRIWTCIRVVLGLWGIYLSFIKWRFPWESLVLAVVFVGFTLYSIWLGKRLGQERKEVVLAANSVLFYPIWVLSLAFTQGVIPFIGLALTLAGCVLLATRNEGAPETGKEQTDEPQRAGGPPRANAV